MDRTPIPEGDAPGAGALDRAEERLRAAEARIEALLTELREIEARDRIDVEALAHLKVQLAEREDIIRRQVADLARLKALVAGNEDRSRQNAIATAMKALTAPLARPKRK